MPTIKNKYNKNFIFNLFVFNLFVLKSEILQNYASLLISTKRLYRLLSSWIAKLSNKPSESNFQLIIMVLYTLMLMYIHKLRRFTVEVRLLFCI